MIATYRGFGTIMYFVLVLFLHASVRAALADAPSEHVLDSLRMIEEGYKANQAAFTHAKCRFIYAVRSANDEKDAISENWNDREKQVSAEVMLYLSSDMFAVRMNIDGKEINKRMADSSRIVTPMNIVGNGEYAIDHDAIVNTAIVHSPQNYHLNVRLHPFNLANDSAQIDPAALIAKARAKNFKDLTFSIEENAEYDGKKFLLLKRSASDEIDDMHYYIDVKRGFLPYITEWRRRKDGKLFLRMFVLDVRQDGDAYFPMHAVAVIPRAPKNAPPYVQVREMKVVELDLNYRPTEDDLTIQVPRYAQFSDGIDPNSAKTLFNDHNGEFVPVSAHQIEDIYKTLKGIAKEREVEAAAVHASRGSNDLSLKNRNSHRLLALVAFNVLILGIVVAWVIIRRRHANSA